MIEQLGLAALRHLDPELAHGLALKALQAGLGPRGGALTSARLKTTLCGMEFPNPIGLAAGFDKNAVALDALSRSAFGFLEVGAATPHPQAGNAKPRLFRLSEDRAAINRFGFNNDGVAAIGPRLAAHRARARVPIGLNLGANKDSADRVADFGEVLRAAGEHIDFATINVSSPNTERLRDLQGKDALRHILEAVNAVRVAQSLPVPLFVKIAPDLSEAEIKDVADVALEGHVDGLIATNTTLARDGLQSAHGAETGGLSGQPLFERSTQVLARLSARVDGKLALIGVGGVATPEQAYAKIRAGASLVQLYTGLVYGGLSLAADLATGLDRLLARDGFASVTEAVGTGVADWT